MLRATEEDPDVRTWDHKTNSKILGLCLHKSNYTANLYILANRIINKHIFRITVIHELGHFLGMGHTDRISVMHKFNYGTILYPTYIDALEFGKIYNCEPDQLCYFKL